MLEDEMSFLNPLTTGTNEDAKTKFYTSTPTQINDFTLRRKKLILQSHQLRFRCGFYKNTLRFFQYSIHIVLNWLQFYVKISLKKKHKKGYNMKKHLVKHVIIFNILNNRKKVLTKMNFQRKMILNNLWLLQGLCYSLFP